jgi:hypothetical protein
LSSSYESETDSDSSNRFYCRPTYHPPPSSYVIFIGIPILLTVLAFSFIPWFVVLKLMVSWVLFPLLSLHHFVGLLLLVPVISLVLSLAMMLRFWMRNQVDGIKAKSIRFIMLFFGGLLQRESFISF